MSLFEAVITYHRSKARHWAKRRAKIDGDQAVLKISENPPRFLIDKWCKGMELSPDLVFHIKAPERTTCTPR